MDRKIAYNIGKWDDDAICKAKDEDPGLEGKYCDECKNVSNCYSYNIIEMMQETHYPRLRWQAYKDCFNV